MTDKVTYTPAEFAALFGKERTWAYRQLYAGKVKAITKLGQIQIPQSEVDKLLNGAERYLGSASHVKRTAKRKAKKKAPVSKGAAKWMSAVKHQRKHGSPPKENARSAGARKLSSPKRLRPDDQANAKLSVYQRLTRCKSSRKDDASRGE
jgi:hypothetical protein